MERESFVGTWDVHVGPSPSALLLNPDGTYLCVSWGGPRSHWGRWALSNQTGQPCLVLQLAGAQPLVEFGPYGPQPVQWSPFESLTLTGSQPDQVSFLGGSMQRRGRPPQVGQPPQPPADAFSSMPPGLMQPAPPPFMPPAPLSPPAVADASAMPPVQIPQVPPVPPPLPHDDVAAQWQQLHRSTSRLEQGANAGAPMPQPAEFTAEQEATIAMYKAQQQGQLDAATAQQQAALAQQQAMLANFKAQEEFRQQAFSQSQALNQAQLAASQQATLGMSTVVHQNNKAFLDYLKS